MVKIEAVHLLLRVVVRGDGGHRAPVVLAEVYTHLMRERYEEGQTRVETYIGRGT